MRDDVLVEKEISNVKFLTGGLGKILVYDGNNLLNHSNHLVTSIFSIHIVSIDVTFLRGSFVMNVKVIISVGIAYDGLFVCEVKDIIGE